MSDHAKRQADLNIAFAREDWNMTTQKEALTDEVIETLRPGEHNYGNCLSITDEYLERLCDAAKERNALAARPAIPSAERVREADVIELARELVTALDGAFISSWQSTAGWKKQLDALREAIGGGT